MTRPLEVGDDVIVSRPTRCCNSNKGIGQTFKIAFFHTTRGWCSNCWTEIDTTVLACYESGHGQDVARLTRLPPLAVLDSLTTELTDPFFNPLVPTSQES